jgi:hypothetical protein
MNIVEPKKPNRYSNGRTRLAVPERGDTPSIAPLPIPKPAPKLTGRSRTVTLFDRLFPFKNRFIILGTIVAVIIIGIVVGLIIHQHNVNKTAINNSAKIITNPGYQTILPEDATISQLGGWERISPPNSDPVFAYADKIDNVVISVSEQPLPASFGSDVDGQVAELAKKFNATNKITAGDTTVYLGTSAKGPQSAIFVKINLLVLIKSQGKINDDAWVKYIKALNVTNKVPSDTDPTNSVTY